jgi:potassium efflux system protein
MDLSGRLSSGGNLMSTNSIIRALGAMVFLALLGAILTPSLASGQDAPSATSPSQPAVPAQSAGSPSLDELKLKLTEIEASQALDQAGKDSAIKLINLAIGLRESFDEFNRQSEAISRQIKTTPQRIKTVHSELAKPLQPPEAVKPMAAGKSALELEQRLQKEQAQLAAAKDLLSRWNDQLSKQKDLLEHLPKNIADAKARLATVDNEPPSQSSNGDPALLIESRRLLLRAEQLKLKAELKVYEQQLNSHEILVAAWRAEQDLAAREIAEREALVKAWQAEVALRAQEDAAKVMQEAEEAKDKTPELASAVKAEYDTNIALGAELEELTRQVTAVTDNLTGATNHLQEIEENFALATERVQTLVLTEAIGMALRRQRQMLPSPDNYRQNSAGRKLKMSEIRELQYKLEIQRRELANIGPETDKIIDSLVYLTPERAEALRSDVRNLLTDRRQLLEKLQTSYNRYFKNLQNLEFAEQQLVAKAEEYADFLDTHLVWIRSSSTINIKDFRNSVEVIKVLVHPARWRLTVSDGMDSFRASPGLWVLGGLISAMLLFGRRWVRRELSRTAEKVKRPRQDNLSLTFWALALTVCLAVGFPFLMFFVAWLLLQLPGPSDFTHAVASGMLPAAGIWAVLGFFYHICRRDGPAHSHFKWPQSARQSLQRNLNWLLPLAVLMTFFISAMATVKEIEFGDSLAKLALIVEMIAYSVFIGWTLRFSGGIVSTLVKNHPRGWLVRLRHIWWPVAVGMPLFLAVLVAIGYFLSALQLRNLISATVLLVMVLTVLNSLALRWFTLARRRFARREARRKKDEEREANRLKQADAQASITDQTGPTIPPSESEIGLIEISAHTQSMLRTVMFLLVASGLWAIWEPVFPAFGILQDIHLWSYSDVVAGVTSTIPISLANLVMAIVVIVITIIASKNMPGLLEITILNRLPMDAGARHAFTTLCRYAITAIGILLAFNTIGFRWSRVQWLIAALGVGLGFGLQEVVANFICGLIVLFERPFTVGDTVTVGAISGTVSRIRIRATTIVDWDRKELIVPNKEFITGQLVNWTLSDPLLRFVTKVGIAYGSDIELAEKILLRVLKENSMIAEDPKPSAYFLGFGDNSLNFELRSFVTTIDHFLLAKHELHKAIDREFRKAGIVISFPQRDVHFDTDHPLKIEVVSDKPKPAPAGPEPESDKSA